MRAALLRSRRHALGIPDGKECCRNRRRPSERRCLPRAPQSHASILHGSTLPSPFPSEYFGQEFGKSECAACDVCLNEIEGMTDSTVTAQKILSCVARTEQRFGAEHIVDVLLGADTERVRRWSHQEVSTYGLLKGVERKALTNMLYQLVDSGLLDRTEDDRPVLRLNPASWEVLRGKREVTLLQPKTKVRKTRFDETSWEGVDRGLFERLRALRHELADARNVPAYVLFSDATLRDMARLRPGNPASLLRVRGVGERKVADLGPQFLALIAGYCIEHGLSMDIRNRNPHPVPAESRQRKRSQNRKRPKL